MRRLIIALLVAAGGSTAASVTAFEQLFNEGGLTEGGLSLSALMEDPQKAGATAGAALLLPIVFYFMRGVMSYLTSVAVLTVAMVAALKFYFGLDTPIEQLAVVTGVGAAVAVGVYRIIT